MNNKESNNEEHDIVTHLSQWWEILFKINNVLLPFFVAWAIWVTGEIYEMRSFRNQGPRFTIADAKNLELSVKQWSSENFINVSYKPEIIEQIKELKITMKELTETINELKFDLKSEKHTIKNK